MNIQYSHLIPVALAALMAGACSDSQSDMPVPVADPATYITFAPPTLNLDATVSDFAGNSNSSPSRALASGVGEFKVWGFCQGRNAANNAEESTTAVMPWNEKSSYFLNKSRVADLTNLNGATVKTDGSYNTTFTEWNSNPNASHSFIGVYSTRNDVTYTMQASGSTTFGKNQPKGPSLKILLPMVNGANDLDAQPDVMIAATFDKKSGSGRVPMTFIHIMTGIRFKIQNHGQKDLIISEITYSGNFYNTAFFDFTTDEPVMTVDDSSTYAGTFTMAKNQTVGNNSSAFAGGETPNVLLLLPNPDGTTDKTDSKFVLGSDKKIIVKYRLDGDPAESADREWESDDNFTLSYLPQPNTIQTANLHFVGDEFVIVFQDDSSKNWENGTTGDRVDITIK